MNAPLARDDIPSPWNEIPPSDEPLGSLPYRDLMHLVLDQCVGLASTCAAAASHPDGMTDGLADALEVLAQYTACARSLFERWNDTQCRDTAPQEEALTGKATDTLSEEEVSHG
jgi:hypothetical protein